MPLERITTKGHKVYLPGKEGPFRCDNCEYYVGKNACNNKHIITFARNGQFGLSMNGENARVDPDGCSDYFERK